MEKTKNNLHKFSQVVYVFAKIGFIAAIVGVCIAACTMICLAITGNTTFEFKITDSITLHGLFAKTDGNAATIWGGVAHATTYCAFLIFVMNLLMRLFANMRDNYTPFTMENAGLFKKMAIWMIVASIVPSAVGEIAGEICSEITGLPFSADYGDEFSLIAVLVLFAMSMVFKYGCALQEQADTTL